MSKKQFITVLDYENGDSVTYDVSAYKGCIDEEYVETLMEENNHKWDSCYWMEHTNYHEDIEYETSDDQ